MQGKLLVAKRSLDEGHLPGYWAVPGGKVDLTDEEVWNILEDTVTREVLEETGVVISSELKMFSNNSFIRTDGQPVVTINFICSYVSGDPQPLDGTTEVRWVDEAEIDNMRIEPNTCKQMHMAFSQTR